MNIHHLKYFIALAKRSNYREAAEFCNVSQPAMSMAIKNFEDRLGEKLFIRQTNPVTLSPFGKRVLPYAESIVHEMYNLMNLSKANDTISGTLRIGVIPTVAPYLIPNFLGVFIDQFPEMVLEIEELTTVNVIKKINQDELDVGIIATPVEGMTLDTDVLYYEDFLAYSSSPTDKKYILPSDIDLDRLWLLEEGHCLRSQVVNLCELKSHKESGIHYNAGSIETLINLVDNYGGITIIPELSTNNFSKKKREQLMVFQPPVPVREVSLVFHKYTIKQKQINALSEVIKSKIPRYMREKEVFNNMKIDL
jgi:LysR family transcriptional regulator, hydrogen peroxide-inducible genes activator